MIYIDLPVVPTGADAKSFNQRSDMRSAQWCASGLRPVGREGGRESEGEQKRRFYSLNKCPG